MQAKYISEGWLTPQERVGLAKWDKEPDWLNRLAGKELSVEEKASRLVELTSMAGMGILTGRTGKIANGERPENFSPDGAGRNGAFMEAKCRSGISVSQQPTKVSLNVYKRGKVQPGLIYEFTVPTSGGGTRKVVIRDDAGGHDFGSGNSQNRGAHFNDEAGGHYDY